MGYTLLANTTEPELESYDLQAADLRDTDTANQYATAPMAAVTPAYEALDEEALHTSFEQAISQRVSSVHERLSRISSGMPVVNRTYTTTGPIAEIDLAQPVHAAPQHHSYLFSSVRQRWTILIGLALIFSMLGFDIMGMLVLHMH